MTLSQTIWVWLKSADNFSDWRFAFVWFIFQSYFVCVLMIFGLIESQFSLCFFLMENNYAQKCCRFLTVRRFEVKRFGHTQRFSLLTVAVCVSRYFFDNINFVSVALVLSFNVTHRSLLFCFIVIYLLFIKTTTFFHVYSFFFFKQKLVWLQLDLIRFECHTTTKSCRNNSLTKINAKKKWWSEKNWKKLLKWKKMGTENRAFVWTL